MTISNSTTGPSYGTDPVAGAVRATQNTASFRHADRSETTSAFPARLELQRLYPSLYPATPARRLRKLVAMFVPNG